jgi:ABC-type nitrate/sulfonate/bicarbonate transport system permease component
MPAILGAVRFSFTFGWLAVALGESASAEWPLGGLGYYIIRAKSSLGNYPMMFAGAIVLSICAFAIDWTVAWLQRRVSIWSESDEAAEETAARP